MAQENQNATMFANNRHLLVWNGITSEGGASLVDLTGKIVKWSLTIKGASGPVLSPLLDFRSDVGTQLTIPNPVAGSKHVQMELLAADTADLAPVETTYYHELEVFEGAGTNPVVVATGELTIRPNVENA